MKAYNQVIQYEDITLDSEDLRQLIARRADMLEGRQRRKYNPTRAAEIKHLHAAYRIVNGFLLDEHSEITAKLAADDVSRVASLMGRRGGSATSEAKAEAARANGRKGGRPPNVLTPDNLRASDEYTPIKKG